MKTAFIIHGSFGNPNENWFPWLKVELEKIGYLVFVPEFPTPENQSLNSWRKVFDEYKNIISDETIFIGHSLGPAFILDILENIDVEISACFFVAGFLGLLGNVEFDEINKTFTDRYFDWNKIKLHSKDFFTYHSDNDPYLPMNKAMELADKLDIKVTEIIGAGHFNADSGYIKFKQLLQNINSYNNT